MNQMKVRIYSSHCSRPDYILFQYTSIQKHVKDEFEYIVINDGQNEASISNFMDAQCRNHIEEICLQLGIQYIPLPPQLHQQRDMLFPKGVKVRAENYSHRSADACQFMLRDSLSFEGIVVMMDSDMFFHKDISFKDYMNGYNLAYLPQDRQGIHYMWNNLVIYKPMELPRLNELNFDSASLPGNPLDAGGMTYLYLLKYKSSLRIRFIQSVHSLSQTAPFSLHSDSFYSIPPLCEFLLSSLGPEIPTDPTLNWQYLDDSIVHYGQGGHWNAQGYSDHLIKTKTFVSWFGESILPKKQT